MEEHATLIERIVRYTETEEYQKAHTLATLGDYLEECFLWEIDFSGSKGNLE